MAKCIAMGLCYCLLLFGLPRQAGAEAPVDYVRDVKTLLKSRCYACHGALKQEAGLRLDSVALMLKGGDSGPAIEQANPEASLLVKRIAAQNEAERMPAEGRPLSSDEIAKVSAWIAAGATAPSDDRPEPDPRDHWAFRRPTRPAAPIVADAGRMRNPIDAFLALEHERHGLTPNPSADRATLLRRVYLDLIGLPPNRDELHAFLADASPEAYEKVVDRLLASPQYGERWGRHWMDVWRYSDWYGRRTVPDVMNSYPMIWRWRDWIVRSLNDDKGYDRMVLEMLAADEVAPEDDQTIVATGYLVRNFFKWNYNQWMKDNVEHTAKAFLGLTLNCAHCHDHKYDPISQAEYFQFRAFFEPLELRQDRVAGAPDPGPFQKYIYGKPYGPIPGGMIRVFDEKLDAQTFMYSGGDERNKIADKLPVAPGVPAMLGLQVAAIEPVRLPAVAAYPGLKPFIQAEELAKRQPPIAAAEQQLAARNEVAGREPALVAALKTAEDKLAAAKANRGESRSQALAGKQSLFLDARQGRRALANPVSAVGAVRNGSTVSFQIKLWADAHANFQLGLDISTGATGAYVAFEQGRILSYRPGTFEVLEIGRYDLAGGQNHFEVLGALDVAQDTIAFTIKSLPDGAMLVDAASAALHGWNPQGRPQQGIFVDARPGSAVAFDEITFIHPGESPAVHFDFEEPSCVPDEDVVGRQGWLATAYCLAPATSVVSDAELPDAAISAAKAEVTTAQQRLDTLRASVTSAEANLAAAKAELAAVQARIAAGNARYLAAADADALAKQAWQAERAAAHAQAAANEQAAALAWLTVATKPGTDAEIAAAKTKLAEAQKATAAAAQAATGNSQEFTLISPVYPQRSTGRRTALAKAIIDRNNPLTARVAANHLWMRHFGQPLVETLFDFGRNGKPASHPELLDWLAVELMEGGWKMKSLHRLIVTSNAYRMASSAGDSPNLQTDKQNRWLWRFPRRQIESEVVRDAVLHSAGRLDLALGGQEIEHAQATATRRRSLYISHHGEAREPLLEMFDAANPAECYRRTQTVVPQQALALVNAELTLQPSRILARHLWRQVAAETAEANRRDAAFVDAAFEQLLTRSPNPAERQAALELLQRQLEVFRQSPAGAAVGDAADASHPAADPALRAKESLIHVLYSHHDFITVR